ncbi:hypothetical protein [Myxacorys almedinensis]|uniref:UPF0367 protein GS601_05865 n=1 Tax=Myxacorys almedinensis A TaxID=2690445 RepID=A0A8J8CHM5_9CYAN|nr:hypothetical protein [Myxacorys almedinensis]NDJ16819.1 hypothetical protein [Myxacorys almedinensis A]
MFIIELTLKTNPIPLSVQRKSEEEAQTTYQAVVDAMKAGGNQLLELTCDRQSEKKLAIFADNLAAVQMYEKSSASSSGRTPGFFSMAES